MKIMTIRSIMVLPLSFLITEIVILCQLPQVFPFLSMLIIPTLFGVWDRKKFLKADLGVAASSFNFYSAAIFWPAGIGIALVLNDVAETYSNVVIMLSFWVSFFTPMAVYTIVGHSFIILEGEKQLKKLSGS